VCAVPASGATLSGRVVDPKGVAVSGATVSVTGATTASAVSTADGTFSFSGLPAGEYEVTVAVAGLDAWHGRATLPDDARVVSLDVTLVLRVREPPVVVTASRGAARGSDPAAPVSVVTSARLALAASPALDDALRATPGFSLFRRTSSRTANPTTQGATLRGLAASGASRALVLADGVALNDPFGGWVYWNRVPQAAIDRVEVVRGASSDLYGADAIGGVVQVLTARPLGPRGGRLVVDADTSAAGRTSFLAAARRGAWHGSASGEGSRTDGTFVVDDATRGAVDRRAGGDHLTGVVSGGVDGRGWRARAHATAFGESRRNGTALQVNDTSVRQVAADVAGPVGHGLLEVSGATGDQTYHQTFSSIATDRATETLTSRQSVPTAFVRAAVQYRLPIGAADLLGGYDSRDAWAVNEDVAYLPGGAVRSTTKTHGDDRVRGLFAQLRTPVGSRASITAGIRNDWWYTGGGDAAASVASPRVSASYRVTSHVVLRGSVSRAFRAPTPNERLRPFRVGNVLTLANPGLRPERLTMGEVGVVIEAERGFVRSTFFVGDVEDAVTNVTLSSTPQLITRQRENAAGIRVLGFESEREWRFGSRLWIDGAFAFTRSTYRDTPGLSGNRVPQVPSVQATVGARWLAPGALTLQGVMRALGTQFDDDRNTLELERATLVDLSASRPFGARMILCATVENLFDVEYDTGRTPTRTIGTPLTARVALRFTY
jgi:outer membrane receptor protein involved in Fe transport